MAFCPDFEFETAPIDRDTLRCALADRRRSKRNAIESERRQEDQRHRRLYLAHIEGP